METADLSRADYWESLDAAPDLRFNPVGSATQEGLVEFVRSEERLCGHVLVATSGSEGKAKWIALSKSALLVSARSVNAHLRVTSADRWLCALPTFHVGGIGIFARAFLGRNAVDEFSGRWRGRAREFAETCRHLGTTLTSLTPTQVFDLVAEKITAPERLRAVVVGGGRLDSDTGSAARALGWPVLASYGMTETGSQIATEPLDALDAPFSGKWLPLLPGWKAELGLNGCLRVRGDALFSGVVREGPTGGNWEFVSRSQCGSEWFETSDLVKLKTRADGGIELQFLGRADDLVKKLGELISLEKLRNRFEGILRSRGLSGTIVALPDERTEHCLVAVVEGEQADGPLGEVVRAEFDSQVAPFERIDELAWISSLPRTELGKIAFGRLRAALTN